MKKRNPLAVFFLSLITLGIYDIYWLVKIKNYLNKNTHHKTPTIWLLFLPFIIAIVLLIVVFAVAGFNSHTGVYGSNFNSAPSGSAVVVLLLDVLIWLVVIPISFYWFLKFSKAVNEYTAGAMSTGLAFILLWLLHFIGVAVVQDSFNDRLAAGPQPQARTTSPQPQPGPDVSAPPPLGIPQPTGPPSQPNPTPNPPTPPPPVPPIEGPPQYPPPPSPPPPAPTG